jgi:ribosomal protein L31
MAKKCEMTCANCGDKFIMQSTAVAERVKKGWCAGCFKMWDKRASVQSDGTVKWLDENPYSSRLDP